MRLILGLIKGIVIGGLIGFGAHSLNWSGGLNWLTYGLIGAFVGLLVGRPIWSHLMDKDSTVVVSVLKAILGGGITIGLYAIVAKALPSFEMNDFFDGGTSSHFHEITPLLGGIIGGVYGAFVEFDDAPKSDQKS